MDTQPEKPRQGVSWRRVGMTLLMIFVGLWVVYPVAMHVMVWYMAHEQGRDPRAAVVHKPLSITQSADLSSGDQAEAFGYSFRVPWAITKHGSAKTAVWFDFANMASLSVFDESGDGLGPGLLVGSTPSQAAILKSMYGEKALNSKYEFLRAELNTTPADISFWHARAQNVAVSTRLSLKQAPLQQSKALYSIAAGQTRGFQVGDPDQDRTVSVWLFDPSDRETWMLFHRGPHTQWTQPQINAVVASVHRSAQ